MSFLFAGMVQAGCASDDQAKPQTKLVVMSFNTKGDNAEPPNAWPDRRPVMAELLNDIQPDIIGTQETPFGQIKDLIEDLPHYEWIGLGREGGSKSEYNAIFYNAERFEPLEYDHYWLSETPKVIASRSWGNRYVRMVTWAKFLDKESNSHFYFVNTHLDHDSVNGKSIARENSAKMIINTVNKFESGVPVFLTGDFNSSSTVHPDHDNIPYLIFTEEGGFFDTWVEAEERKGEGLGTFNSFKYEDGGGADKRIDWILAKGDMAVRYAEISNYQKNGHFPSDHFPVIAEVVLPNTPEQ
ncbi:endonuclease/exonuclease/phosphatase family protein [Paenibacillus senegalensis]|uniref:endonuclease/exonuclease/phosphatase family protein n=1 Tax=Paenibacillus senegalensis TaxID=1465766 RepID=UPI000288CEED|nr:endonuclease/exonuclease/phosphatase family protein [Paenibacillus senegalensis]